MRLSRLHRDVRWRIATMCSVLAVVIAAPRAQAQGVTTGSRQAELAAARDKKASEVTPPQRTIVERGLYWYDNQYVLAKIFGDWHGFHLAGGDFPAGAGTTIGVGFAKATGSMTDSTAANRFAFESAAANSTRGYRRLVTSASVLRVAGAPIDVRALGQYYEFPQEDFFGLGADSRAEQRTNYLQDAFETGAELRWRPTRFIEFGSGVALVRPSIDAGTDSRFPSTDEVFDPSTLPGFAEQPDFIRADASATVDWRDNPQHPHSGGSYAVRFSNFADQELDTYTFRRVAFDAQHYVTLPNRYRIIALRASAVFTDADAGQDVPFFYQPTLGGARALRGFREFRFRDRNSLLLTAEYRWEASWLLDGALFVDAGNVGPDRSSVFTLRDLDVTYGVGFRVHSNRAFVARLDLAFSREGFIPLLRFDHVF